MDDTVLAHHAGILREHRSDGTPLQIPFRPAQARAHGRFGPLGGPALLYARESCLGNGRAREDPRVATEDGLPHVFATNVLAPYVLTALMPRPKRLVYLSSGLHHGAAPDFEDLLWTRRLWQGTRAYAESKFLDVLLAFAVARRWPGELSNALEPGWVATRMGGPAATDDLAQGHLTQVWLAIGDDPVARVTGGYFFHEAPRAPDSATRDEAAQDALIAVCADLSGIALPA